MNQLRIAFWTMAFVALGGVPCIASIPLAAKAGQKVVDRRSLPFAALTITMDGGALPLEEIVFENLRTHTEAAARLARTFSDKADYLTAMEPGNRLHAQLILRMQPGRYRIKRIGFYLKHQGRIGSATIDLEKMGAITINVQADVVNFCGSLVIAADWGTLAGLSAGPNESVEESFRTAVGIEATQTRDRKWACDVIPGLRDLPWAVSPSQQEVIQPHERNRPQPIATSVPSLPDDLRRKGIGGEVLVEFDVGPDGRVHDATIVSAPDQRLGAIVLKATPSWRFLPAVANGKPVTTRLRMPITFQPNGK